MQWSRFTRWGAAMLTASSLIILPSLVAAELKPGDKLDKSNCQEAKGLLPDYVMEKFCDGKYTAEIIEVKDEAFQYSQKFRAGSEANAGKYYVSDEAICMRPPPKAGPTSGTVSRSRETLTRKIPRQLIRSCITIR